MSTDPRSVHPLSCTFPRAHRDHRHAPSVPGDEAVTRSQEALEAGSISNAASYSRRAADGDEPAGHAAHMGWYDCCPTESTTVDIKVAPPLPSRVLMTLGSLLEAAYPGALLATNDEPYRNQVIFRIDNAQRQDVDAQSAADMRVEPSDDDLDILALGPEGTRRSRPRSSGQTFCPIIKAAFGQNPDAANYSNSRSTTRKSTSGTS